MNAQAQAFIDNIKAQAEQQQPPLFELGEVKISREALSVIGATAVAFLAQESIQKGGKPPKDDEETIVFMNRVTRKTKEIGDGLLARHKSGDWGDLHKDDIETNEQALKFGNRIMSVYKGDCLEPLWIITDADRSTTTILTPDEY